MEQISIVRGNDFRLRVPIKRHVLQPDGSIVEKDFAIEDAKVLKVFLEGSSCHAIELPWTEDEEHESSIICDVDGLIPLGTYHLIVAGKRSDDAKFRSKERRQLRIVENNERANIWPSEFDSFEAYSLDTMIILDCRGRDGLSAYEIAVLNGFTGTETQWLKSLAIKSIVKTGTDYLTDTYTIIYSNGAKSTYQVQNGESAYQAAVRLGKFYGTEEEWATYARWPEVEDLVDHTLRDMDVNVTEEDVEQPASADMTYDQERDPKIQLNLHNIKGRRGNGITAIEVDEQVGDGAANTVTIKTDDNPDGASFVVRNGTIGPKGDKGDQGDSAVYDPDDPDTPDFVMANTPGQSTTKAMTQKAVTDAIVDGNLNTGYNPINESQYPANLENISIEMADRGFTAEVIRKKGTSGDYFFGVDCTAVFAGRIYNIEFDYESDWTGNFVLRDSSNNFVFGGSVAINEGTGHVSIVAEAVLDSADFSFTLPQATPVGSSLTVSNLTITAISKANAKSNQLESDVSVLQQDSIRYSDTGYNPLGKSQIDANEQFVTITPTDNGFTAEVIQKKGSSTSAYFVGITCKALKVGKTYKIEFDYDSDWSGGFSFRNDEEANVLYGMSYSTGTGHISVVKEATGDSESFTFTLPQDTSVGSEMSVTNLTIEEVVKIKNVVLQSEEDIEELKNALTTYKTTAYESIIRSTNVENYAKEFDFEEGKEYTIKMSIPEAATSSVELICYQSRSDGTGKIGVVSIPIGKTSAQVSRTIPVANKYIGVWSSEVKSYYCTIEISENVITPKVEKEEKVELNEISVNLSSFLDGVKTDSQCIDDCLSFVNSFHKKTITIDSDLMIDKAILLDSNTTVLLQDCTIQLNNGVYDNIFRGANIVLPEPNSDDNMFYVPEDISYLENVHIIGNGNSKLLGCNVNRIYDGSRFPSYQGQAMVGDQYGARAVGVCFTCIKGGSIEGVSFEKNRSYAMQLEYCSDFTIKDIQVTSDCKNGDGIDVRTGCRNITIKNFGGVTSDDLIAINSALSDKDEETFYVCPMKYSWRWEKNISDDLKEIKGVYIDNLVDEAGSNHHAVAAWSAGNNISDVSINNVIIRGDITSDNIGHIALFGQGSSIGRTFRNVRVSNVFFDKASDSYPAVVMQNIVDGMIADVRRANNTLVSLGDTGNAQLFNIQ